MGWMTYVQLQSVVFTKLLPVVSGYQKLVYATAYSPVLRCHNFIEITNTC